MICLVEEAAGSSLHSFRSRDGTARCVSWLINLTSPFFVRRDLATSSMPILDVVMDSGAACKAYSGRLDGVLFGKADEIS